MDHPQERGRGKTGPADHPRGSRFYQRQPRPGGKLMISSPVGPVLKNGKPMTHETSSPSTAITYENAYPVKPTSMDRDRNNKENSPPEHYQPAAKPHVSKSSRALHVLSSITHTFSRSSLSLASFKTNRNFSGASASSSIVSTEHRTPKASTSSSSMRRPLIPRFDTRSTAGSPQPEPYKTTTRAPQPSEPDKIVNERAEPVDLDPKLIYTAQPSAYWTGRFTALRDKYHNEVLEPDTLHIVLEEHMRRSNIEHHLVDDRSPADDTNPPKSPTTLLKSPSSTSGAPAAPRTILKSTPSTRLAATIGASGTFTTSRPPLSSGLSRIPSTKPNTTTAPTTTRRHSHDIPPSHSHEAGTMPPPPPPTIASSILSTTTTTITTPALAQAVPPPSIHPPSQNRRHTLLLQTSDDARRRRVFAALASLCATPAARESLRQWQAAYARRTGREWLLLPAGEGLVGVGVGRGGTTGTGLGVGGGRGRGRGGKEGGGEGGGGGGGGEGGGSLTRGWKREGSVASSGAGGGLVGRLRRFSAGRRSQLNAMEMGRGPGSVGGVVSEPGHVPGWVGQGQRQEEGRLRVRRIRRVEHGLSG
ncbi:hypothetical protein BR93DRAFT_940688 [Coniochaeta sp. PMI_546]|nr:hypothetical protein BR93DRAFT_940688 [Coniochaeta sp. PMI_546]